MKHTYNLNLHTIIRITLLLLILSALQGCGAKNASSPYSASQGFLQAAKIEQDIHTDNFEPTTADQLIRNSFDSLSVPTHITKVDDTYFMVDCYHDQVIYSDTLGEPLQNWYVLTNQINKGHTLASDGFVYLVDDTENHRVVVFEKDASTGTFYHTQTLSEIGVRPHYIVYHEPTDTFYVWSSMNGEMYLMRRDPADSHVYLTEIRTIAPLAETYVRSFSIIDDKIYFVSGIPSAVIVCADLDTFNIRETYTVPDSLAGMVQLTKIDNDFYITVSTDINGNQDYATMIKTSKLSDLSKGKYEDVYENFIGGGTPYYISEIDNTYYLTEHRLPGHSIWKFGVDHGEIHSVEAVY